MSSEFRHRPTLKQSNKPFKAKHRSKGDLKRQSKGKIETAAPRVGVKQIGKNDAKNNRRNFAKQVQGNKRAEVIERQRKGRADDGAPRLVVRTFREFFCGSRGIALRLYSFPSFRF
jgi:pre-rRNA-processing protein TSR1